MQGTAQCPRCGCYCGPAGRCANCGLRLGRRLELRLLRAAALALAFGGLFLLRLYAMHRELPLVRVGEVSPAMNFASVRMSGVLESDARKIRSGSILLLLDDGTGTIPLFFDRLPSGRLPTAGTRIEVVGTLGVAAGSKARMNGHSLRLLSASPDAPSAGDGLAAIGLAQTGEWVVVRGRVSRVWKPRPGSRAPWRIVLSDAGGSLDVVHWLDLKPPVVVGDELEVCGVVGAYRGKVQLKVRRPADIRAVGTQPLPAGKLRVSDIGKRMEGRVVSVEGVLGPPRSIPGGVVYPLGDGGGTISVVFWDRMVPGEERDALDEGVRVRITAPVKSYKGRLELVPKDLGAFQVLE